MISKRNVSLFQVTKTNDDLKKKIDELQTEMRKFKAVFLKQENRIRGLEGKITSITAAAETVSAMKYCNGICGY